MEHYDQVTLPFPRFIRNIQLTVGPSQWPAVVTAFNSSAPAGGRSAK